MKGNQKRLLMCILVGCISFGIVASATVYLYTRNLEHNAVGGLETPNAIETSQDVMENVIGESPESDISLSYISYRVQKGDMIGHIAQAFGITQDTLFSVNNIHSSRNLQIGQYLKVPSLPGILYTVKKEGETLDAIAQKYRVDCAKCACVNNLTKEEGLPQGLVLFIPDAKMDDLTKQEINGDLFTKPLHSRYYISSSFGWRASPFTGARSYHSGLDMAANYGTKIYASLAGKVTATGYNSTYGNYVIIQHHSGYKTLYGHMSAILVAPRQNVTSSTVIGRVGSTGLSTGPHLHFTVYKNGKTVNPAVLIR